MKPILKDLCALIRKSTMHYDETCEQHDVVLSEDFKQKFTKYLVAKNYSVDFYQYTAVISTSNYLRMFIPNQWFVIASYALGVYTELKKYKQFLFDVLEEMGEKPKIIIPKLRENSSAIDRAYFFEMCKRVFADYDSNSIELASKRLWQFVTNYTWWSGNKTIDRVDFHMSVILNMLSLVNASQGYVADLVEDYYKSGLGPIVSDLSLFTENLTGSTYEIEDYCDPQVFKDVAEKESFTPSEYVQEDNSEIVINVRSKK